MQVLVKRSDLSLRDSKGKTAVDYLPQLSLLLQLSEEIEPDQGTALRKLQADEQTISRQINDFFPANIIRDTSSVLQNYCNSQKFRFCYLRLVSLSQ